MPDGSTLDRAVLRQVLRDQHGWLTHTDLGPQAVTAGECDVCGEEARLVQPCGPPPEELGRAATPDWAFGRRCAALIGTAGWCDGHEEEAQEALAWLADLPEEADTIARLWWVATGEVRPDEALLRLARRALAAESGTDVPQPPTP